MIYLAISSPNSSLVLGLGSASVTIETETKQVHSVAWIYFEKSENPGKNCHLHHMQRYTAFQRKYDKCALPPKKKSQGNV